MSNLNKMLLIVLAQQAIALDAEVKIGDTAEGSILMDNDDTGARYKVDVRVIREGMDGQRLRITVDLIEQPKIAMVA